MKNERATSASGQEQWQKATPRKLPDPTYWPFFLAMGLAFFVWGFIAGWIICMAGLLILMISLTGWVKILRNESGRNKNDN
ncbi:MAG TPA: hypothetical protein VFL76_02205 [Edaphocola sp.]|nr:hypothetical protein [Edaphocola sp.]